MQIYQKFMVEVIALTNEINEASGDAKDGMVPVDARLLNLLVRLSSGAREGLNKHLEFAVQQGIQRVHTRFNPKEGAVIDAEVQSNGQSDAA